MHEALEWKRRKESIVMHSMEIRKALSVSIGEIVDLVRK